MILASAIAAIIPILLYLFLIRKYDYFEPEPISLYLKNFLWGAIGAVFLALIGNMFFSFIVSIFIHNPLLQDHITTIVGAPIVEEITKGMFLLFIVSNRNFDNMTDGIVYGGAIGLGFGMTENFLYFITYGNTLSNWIILVIVRTLFTAVMHCVSTATFGAFLGYAKFKPLIFKIILPPLGLLTAILIHSAWNFSVSFNSTAPIGIIFMTLSILLFIYVFRKSLSLESKMIYLNLYEEAETGLIPKEHLSILNCKNRDMKGWIDEGIRKEYIKKSTELAFRKMQFNNSSGYNKNYYLSQINYLREAITKLLYLENKDEPNISNYTA